MNEATRRRFLASTAAVSTGALLGGTQTAAAADYEKITVGAGETFTKQLSDGETWENKLIDITADGASYSIRAHANNWTIRNIGFRGQLDKQAKPDSQIFTLKVPSADATGVLENIYHEGTTYSRSYNTQPSGFYVFPDHAGDIEARGLHLTNFPSHALYGSAPGNPPSHSWQEGGGGTVRVHDSYTADMENSGWRLGTTGSYIENCVSFRTSRGLWAYYEDIEARDCDLGENNRDIVVGSGSYSKSATVTVENTRYETTSTPNGSISGSSAGTPQERVPDACPTSPKEAASGASGSNNTGDGDTPSDGNGSNDSGYDGDVHPGNTLADNENALVFSGTHLSEDNVQQSQYKLAVSESLVPSRRSNATVDENLEFSEGDTSYQGTVTDWKDAWVYTGEITELTVDGPAKVFLNGSEIDPSNYGSTGGGSDDSGDGNSSAPPQDDGSGNAETPRDGDQRSDFDDEWVENFLDSLFDDGSPFDTIIDTLFN